MPDRPFTYPFCYVPAPEVIEASRVLIERIDSSPELRSTFAEGKMMGTLITDGGVLYAFSGLAGGKACIEGFAPPIFDYTRPEGHFRRREAEISSMPAGPERKAASAELQDYLFEHYRVLNALGEEKSIKEVFAMRGLVPPGGTGECAAPKLLQWAYSQGLKPIAMGEFWYGASPRTEVRQSGSFYPSCMGKCGPLLSYMLQGLEVEANPLDKKYCGTQPEVMFCDEDIIVVNKPSGMLSVPGRTEADSLLDWLRARYGDEVESCHRLDMDTSGVMVYARHLEAKKALEAQFAAGEVKKCYRARLCSAPKAFKKLAEGTIDLPLMLDYYDRPRQIVDFKQGKRAVTDYKIEQILPNGEVEVLFYPRTGRSHQLRVHAAHHLGLGRPIKGDKLYGDPSADRLHLHAESICFKHPGNGEIIIFETLNE